MMAISIDCRLQFHLTFSWARGQNRFMQTLPWLLLFFILGFSSGNDAFSCPIFMSPENFDAKLPSKPLGGLSMFKVSADSKGWLAERLQVDPIDENERYI